MRTTRVAYLCGCLCLVADPVAANDIRFTERPAVTQTTGGVRIVFTVSRPADVEVAVLDNAGRVVRHLAAGVLGGAANPPEPLRPGLAQDLVWDRNDNAGRPAQGGPFQVRVRAGMSVKFGRLIGYSPYTGNVTSTPYRAPAQWAGRRRPRRPVREADVERRQPRQFGAMALARAPVRFERAVRQDALTLSAFDRAGKGPGLYAA